MLLTKEMVASKLNRLSHLKDESVLEACRHCGRRYHCENFNSLGTVYEKDDSSYEPKCFKGYHSNR